MPEPLTHTVDLLVDTSLPEAERLNLLRAYEAGRRQALLDGAPGEDDAAPDPLASLREAAGSGRPGRRATAEEAELEALAARMRSYGEPAPEAALGTALFARSRP